ncbi:MAG: hypothetical protein H7X95_06520, partial [Deltaproteobacteria bacterium]|nr:hypothetical protein [Deltaproteobacteria bacterium]
MSPPAPKGPSRKGPPPGAPGQLPRGTPAKVPPPGTAPKAPFSASTVTPPPQGPLPTPAPERPSVGQDSRTDRRSDSRSDSRSHGQRKPAAGSVAAIEIANVSDGGFIYWLFRFYAFGVLAVLGLGACAALGTYVYFAATLPPMPDLARYQSEVATTTVVRGWDGTPLAEFATERREILPFERFP